jgi:adenylyltransferase/sulfurtransferase
LSDKKCSFGSFPTAPASLPLDNEKTAIDLNNAMNLAVPFILVDVRDPAQTSICKIDSSISLPLRLILQDPDLTAASLRKLLVMHEASIFVICRRGLDSRIATIELLKLGFVNVYSISGGLDSWRRIIDPLFPAY